MSERVDCELWKKRQTIFFDGLHQRIGVQIALSDIPEKLQYATFDLEFIIRIQRRLGDTTVQQHWHPGTYIVYQSTH